ncbi:MAG TPA: GGDEF domain-containing protein, partial [Blastocatellia bacterium]|nr:GGDEF domain-containing protein [Blastocatellia bacterium]
DALRGLGGLLSHQLRSEDFLSRYAGDEFVALVRIEAVEVRDLIERLQHAVDNSRFGSDSLGVLGISVGWACFGADGTSIDELLLAADRAMYADKLRRKVVVAVSDDQAAQPDQYHVM